MFDDLPLLEKADEVGSGSRPLERAESNVSPSRLMMKSSSVMRDVTGIGAVLEGSFMAPYVAVRSSCDRPMLGINVLEKCQSSEAFVRWWSFSKDAPKDDNGLLEFPLILYESSIEGSTVREQESSKTRKESLIWPLPIDGMQMGDEWLFP